MKRLPQKATAPPLPSNLVAERAVLNAIVVDNTALDIVRQILTPEDFFSKPHEHIFRHMTLMREANTAIDLVVLHARLSQDGGLESLGGATYIAELGNPLGRAPNVEKYARIVKENSTLRAIIHLTDKVQERAFKSTSEAAGLVADELYMRVEALLERAGSTTKKPEFFDTFAEFEAAAPLSFAIEGFLQNDAITGIAGLSGDGKTWCALAMGSALLFGPGRLWDLFVVPERAEKVIYLIPESSRTPFKHRLQLTGLYDEIRTGRLLVRTLSKGPTPSLTDVSLLRDAKGAYVIVDTAVRFMGEVDESSGTDIAEGLSNDFLELLRAEARSVVPLFHSPKSFAKEKNMTLEAMIRGSSEFGAVLATAWGIKQIDEVTNTVHIQNLKPRDFEPCGAFQIIGRPYINQTGDFHLLKAPGDCGSLEEEQPNDYNREKHDQKTDRIAITSSWLAEDPNLSSPEMVNKFKLIGIDVNDSTVRRYRKQARKGGI